MWGWVVPRASLDSREEINSCHCQESNDNSSDIHFSPSHHTHYALSISSVSSNCINAMKVLYDHLTNFTVLFLFIYRCLYTTICGSISNVVLDQNTLVQFFVLTFCFTNFRNSGVCSYHFMHYVLLDTVLFRILMVFAMNIWASLAVSFL
jgi:hypothetical protein